ncbi:MAG: PIN domain-containing protein [Sulfuricaulis sp.]|uniref:putative toxin-antitoxin system toxin component, PIN family n=1 Tax=Sulfuricaulis sp. TaxID=2003553 RepID=UPI0034A40EA8
MRIFFDTNVLASALMGHGLCRDLLDRALIGHEVLLGEPVREELRRVLTTKFRVPTDLWHELDRKLREFEQAPAATAPLGVSVSDADDVPIIACALYAKADVFVTGDKGLLNLSKIEGMPMLSPRELWQRLTGTG